MTVNTLPCAVLIFKFENLRCLIALDGSFGFVACQAAREFMKRRGRKRPYRFSTVFFGSDTRRTSFLTQIVVTHAIDCKLSTVGRVTPCALTDRKSSSRGFTDVPLTQGLLKSKEPIRVLRWANSPNRNYTARRVALLSAEELGLSTELCPWLLLSRSMFVAARYFGCCDIIQGTCKVPSRHCRCPGSVRRKRPSCSPAAERKGALLRIGDLSSALNLRRESLDRPSRCPLYQRSGLGLERRLSLSSVRHLHRALYRFASRK